MHLGEINIKNYKSIKDVKIPVKKYGNSYTSIFVGLNEVGKSNLLEAISILQNFSGTYVYSDICNRACLKEDIKICYKYNFSEDELDHYISDFIDMPIEFKKNFELKAFNVELILKEGEQKFSKKEYFSYNDFNLENFSLSNTIQSSSMYIIKCNKDIADSEKSMYTVLSVDNLNKLLLDIFKDVITKQEVSVWKANDKYLINDKIPLMTFIENPTNYMPLFNLFALCGFDTKEKIKSKIQSLNDTETRKLEKILGRKVSNYINNVWKEQDIFITVSIDSSTKNLSVYIVNKKNDDEFFKMKERSQGFKQFISLILSLSIQNNKDICKNQIIVIDEPEIHLHPSGIRYMKNELLKIGRNNYVFVATHSPFLIDDKDFDRQFLIKKEKDTILEQMNIYGKIYNDDVLQYAFGLNVLRDLLPSNKLLLEGQTDFNIIRKGLNELCHDFCIGITNGHGANIEQVASSLKYSKVDSLVIVDDDIDGQNYKKNILNIGDPYNDNNVKTIRDLCHVIAKGTIEDTLNYEYVISKINEVIKTESLTFTYSKTKPVLEELKVFLLKNGLKEKCKVIIENVKNKIGEDFNPSKLDNYPILKELLENIIKHFEENK